jgi:hypothetical protein
LERVAVAGNADIGVLGLLGIMRHPGVLVALDPRYGLGYLFGHGLTGFLVLGGVFLCATGAEFTPTWATSARNGATRAHCSAADRYPPNSAGAAR